MPKPTAEHDAELVDATRAGDTDAFRLLVERYKDRLVNYLTQLTSDRSEAEDLAQEAFVRFYERIERYRDRGQLGAYLYRIGYNLLVTRERRRKRWRSIRELFLRPSRRDDAPETPGATLMKREIHEQLHAALTLLPAHQRTAIVLAEIEGFSYREIATVLDCSEGTVKSRIHRGRRALRELLSPYWHGTGAPSGEALTSETAPLSTEAALPTETARETL